MTLLLIILSVAFAMLLTTAVTFALIFCLMWVGCVIFDILEVFNH